MQAKYIVIEVWEDKDNYSAKELYDAILEIMGGGAVYDTDQSNLYYLVQRCAEDLNRIGVLVVGNPDEEEEE